MASSMTQNASWAPPKLGATFKIDAAKALRTVRTEHGVGKCFAAHELVVVAANVSAI